MSIVSLFVAALVAGAPIPAGRAPSVTAVDAALVTLERRATLPASVLAGIRDFYERRGDRLAWVRDGAWSPSARALRATLAAAGREGLDDGDYPLPDAPATRDSLAWAAADVALSATALVYAHDVGWGAVVPGEANRSNHYAARPFDADSVLTGLATAPDAGAALQGFAPTSPLYRSLRGALHALDSIVARGGWRTPTAGPALRPGAKGPRIAELRAILAERGDLAVDAAPGDSFDLALVTAVLAFQRRHGLEPDTVYGARMVEELVVPAGQRRGQVRLGMERARWLPPTPATGRWITVNLADFQATLYDAGRVTWRSRTVIGKRFHETPLFVDTMELVVINPSWHVPPSIARNEIGPRLRRDPGYLARNHMVRTSEGFRQLPGAWNALGGFKFLFPNQFSIYMHDTPSRAAFQKADRAFSHGCVRLQDPAGLARVLLGAQGVTPERIAALREAGTERAIRLASPVQVRITYATAFLGDDGTLQYRRDVYARDGKLAAALGSRARHRWSAFATEE
jgi:murein L,D-transpeptidase YcbB/YkuD